MKPNRLSLWTIDQLGAQTVLALSVDYGGAPNGRVRDVPDRRTIRYYTTLGILDRPAEMQGRTALYGPKHLLQLVAIKRLQARGLSLAEIQEQLLGSTETALRKLAQLPEDLDYSTTANGADDSDQESASSQRAGNFWSAAPVPGYATAERHAPADSSESPDVGAALPKTLQGIRLSAELTLLIEALRPVHEDEISALRVAAAPLLKLLEKRRLIRPSAERGSP